jgi:EpsI family protein
VTRPALHFVLAAVLLATVGIFLRGGHREVLPYHLPLRLFPQEIGMWRGTDVPIAKDVLSTLGPGDFLLRGYKNSDHSQQPLDLFIAYFPSQGTGDTIHSPQNCLPGAGWTPMHADRIVLSVQGFPSFPANRYLIAKGDSRQFVLYWYWAHDRGVASEYLAKFYLVADSIRMHRSDGAIIRITTPLFPGESLSGAEQRVLPFANTIIPMLDSYIPN